MSRKRQTRLIAATFLCLSIALGQNYTDSFEGTVLDPFWTVTAAPGNSDTVGPSTDFARTGASSLKFTSYSGTNRYVLVGHTFPQAVKGAFTVYLYDDTPGQARIYEYMMLTSSSNPFVVYATVGVDDYEPSCYKALIADGTSLWAQNPLTNPCQYNDPGTKNNTNLPRVVGWHRFDIETTAVLTTVKIDGQTMVTGPALDLDTIYLVAQAPSWRPAGVAYFDDFSFAQAPVGPAYEVKLLYEQTKAVKSGATIPIKLQLCDASGANLSSPSIVLHATSLVQLSTNTSEVVQDAGNANPDSDFRYDPALGGSGGYIFNLKTTGLATGTYRLSFTVSGDSATYSVLFQVK